ncbi:cytochrome P450 [Streptomyces sp. NPDC007983]|uniref:cytochrome P450 n=1 Tax=Streptomyces sp. NPDC007983 TaxID=3364800 RepID=UPI0036EA7281
MTSAQSSVGGNPAKIPDFPMTKSAGCPFDPAPELYAQRQEGPLTRVRLWDGSTPWLVTGFAEQRAALADPRVSADADRPGYPHTMPLPPGGVKRSFIGMDDPEHARLRRMVTAPFAVKRVEAMRPAVQRIVDDLIDDLLAGPNPTDLVEAFALPVPSLVISELLGVPYDDHAFFQENSKTIIQRTSAPEQRQAAHAALTEYLDGLVGEKLDAPGDDLLSGLAERIAAGELTRPEAARMGTLMLIAGHETTANMIALGTLALLENPDQLALLRGTDDPKLVASAVEELLRYLNIVHNGRMRVAREDLGIAGRTVRAGEGLIMPNEIANRDPDAFPDPDRLDITRDARRHVAFGFGVHQCLGQPLARMELQVVYSTLYRRIPTLELAIEPDQVPFKYDGLVHGVYELPVTW